MGFKNAFMFTPGIILPLILWSHFWALRTTAQGCSDAGICTIRSFKPETQEANQEYRNQANLGLSIAGADHSILALGSYLGYSLQAGKRWGIDTRITYLVQSGNEITVSGPGDIFANINYQIGRKWTLTAGGKIPLTKGDKFYNDNKNSKIDMDVGFPLIVRKARPDGLTRQFVMTAEFAKYF